MSDEKTTFDFSDEWEEIQPVIWQWIMWDTPNQKVLGWVVELRTEEFTDKQTGEKRENLVCYMITPMGESVRFIVPTDLRIKLNDLNDKRIKAKADWLDIMVKITYTGKAKTLKGYEIKTFSLKVKRNPIPDELKKQIPELPSSTNDEDVINELLKDF